MLRIRKELFDIRHITFYLLLLFFIDSIIHLGRFMAPLSCIRLIIFCVLVIQSLGYISMVGSYPKNRNSISIFFLFLF